MTFTQSVTNVLQSNWTKVGLVLSLLGIGAATVRTVDQIKNVPGILARHDSVTVELLQEFRELNKTHHVQLCLNVAQLRHSDWTRCLVEEP